jgi:hypothetical protein
VHLADKVSVELSAIQDPDASMSMMKLELRPGVSIYFNESAGRQLASKEVMKANRACTSSITYRVITRINDLSSVSPAAARLITAASFDNPCQDNVNTASHDTMMQSCSNNLFQINSSVSYGILEFTGINIDKQLGKDKLCDFGCRSVFSDPRRLLARRSACFRVSWPLCCD